MDVYEELIKERDAGRRAALATIVNVVGSVPSYSTAKMLVREDGTIVGTIGGGAAEAEVMIKAREVIATGDPAMVSFKLHENPEYDTGMVCGGSLDIFVEPVVPQPVVYIFGCGHIGRLTARAAEMVGLATVVVDDRREFANSERFPAASAVHAESYDTVTGKLSPNANGLVFIATRCHDIDARILKWALGTPAGYIGMIGSKRKVVQVYDRLVAEGVAPDCFNRVRAPVGLDLGAKTPEEIAFSVVAEMIAHIRRGSAAISLSRNMGALAQKFSRDTASKDKTDARTETPPQAQVA